MSSSWAMKSIMVGVHFSSNSRSKRASKDSFGIRCAGPFAAYGLGLAVPKATKNSGVISLVAGTIGFLFWQYLSGGDFYLGVLPVVFGCAVSVVVFFVVNAIEWKRGVKPAPSAYVD